MTLTSSGEGRSQYPRKQMSETSIDVGRLARIAGAIRSTLAQSPAEQRGTSGSSMPDAYSKYRRAVSEVLEGTDLQTEFNDLFPEKSWLVQISSGERYRDPFDVSNAWGEATALLADIAGWLESFHAWVKLIAEAQVPPPGQYL